ncbi:hypothetical protein L9F63_020592, partial [Diploptera punctata]
MELKLLILGVLFSAVCVKGGIISRRSIQIKDKIKFYSNLVAIHNMDNTYCTGYLLSENDIITAAHCLQGSLSIHGVYVRSLGSTGIDLSAYQIYIHPEYNPDGRINDIAIIKISQSLKYDTPISLAHTAINETSKCTVGKFTAQEDPFFRNVEVIDCQGEPKNMICVTANSVNSICKSEAGAPLICSNELVGIAVSDSSCNTGSITFQNVMELVEWIQNVITEQISNVLSSSNQQHYIRLISSETISTSSTQSTTTSTTTTQSTITSSTTTTSTTTASTTTTSTTTPSTRTQSTTTSSTTTTSTTPSTTTQSTTTASTTIPSTTTPSTTTPSTTTPSTTTPSTTISFKTATNYIKFDSIMLTSSRVLSGIYNCPPAAHMGRKRSCYSKIRGIKGIEYQKIKPYSISSHCIKTQILGVFNAKDFKGIYFFSLKVFLSTAHYVLTHEDLEEDFWA